MARSAEKAMTALARWRAAFVNKVQDDKRRPFHTIECQDCKDAMLFRRQIVQEMTRKITQIQNPSLGEYKIRDLNDEINKLIKEKTHWEERIKELGGPDYKADAPKVFEKDGKEAPGYRGYRYFGAARDLPAQPAPRKTRGELMKYVDVSYYGNCDEDDDSILVKEKEYEQQVFKRKIEIWKRKREEEKTMPYYLRVKNADKDIDDIHQDDQNIYDIGENPIDQELSKLYEDLGEQPTVKKPKQEEENLKDNVISTLKEDLGDDKTVFSGRVQSVKKAYVAHVPVFSQEQVEEALIAKKKQELLDKYVSEDLMATISEAGALLGHDSANSKNLEPEIREVSGFNPETLKTKPVDPNKAVLNHPLYDDSADEDEGVDEEEDLDD